MDICVYVHYCSSNLCSNRFFTGHGKDPDGKIRFKAGKTSVSDAVDGAIKILTVAVRALLVRC